MKEIADLEASPRISRYHVIAHLHGGNVVLHALRSLADDPKKLGAVIFLGTPVLRFSRLAPWLNRSAVAMLFYGIGLVYGITVALRERLVIEVAERPGDALKQLFSTKAPPKYAVKPQRPEFWKVFWTDFKKTAVYHLLRVLFPYLPAPMNPASQQANASPKRATRRENDVETSPMLSRLSQATMRKDTVEKLLLIIACFAGVIYAVNLIMQITVCSN